MSTASACLQYGRSGERYASDVTNAEFALIEPLLRSARCMVRSASAIGWASGAAC